MTSLPLPLAYVLEEEDVRLYGDDAPRVRRWLVREEEVPDARSLAQKLSERLTNAPESISRWRESNGYDPEYRKRVVIEINGILESIVPKQWLFEHEAFVDADRQPYSDLQDASLFDPDEVFNLNREMFDGLFAGDVQSAADLHFKEIIRRIHARVRNGTPRTALSISGGGIRSATYALGILQGLARRHILEKFDFLSTISGGGYIGAWLSSWVRRDPWGIRGVCGHLASEPTDPLAPEPQPIRHLRAYSSYLVPRLGAFSADSWALAATYFRNVLLNWMVLIPLLAGLLSVPRFLFTAVVHNPRGSIAMDLTSKGAAIAFALGILLLSFGFGVLIRYRPVAETKTTKSLTDGKFVTWCLLPLLFSAVAFLLGWAWHVDSGRNEIGLASFFGAALLSTTAGFFVFLWRFLRSPFSEKSRDAKSREKHRSMRILAELGASVAAGLTGGLLSWLAATHIFPEPVQAVSRVSVVRWPILDPGGLSDVTASYVCFGVPLLLGILFLQAAIFVGASSHVTHDFDREWWSRASGWVLLAALGWIGFSTIAIYGPVAIYHIPRLLSSLGGAAGLFSVLAGKSGSTQGTEHDKGTTSTGSKVLSIALVVAVPIFVLYVLALISLGTTKVVGWAMNFEPVTSAQIALETRQAEHAKREYTALIAESPAKLKETPLANAQRLRSYEHLTIVQTANPYLMLAIVLGSPLIALLVSRCIGVNVFSMHAMYRNRLVRAYLGASRWSRDPNGFTGFDPHDNLPMHELRPEYVWWHSFRDLDHAIGLLANARDPRLQLIATELRRELGNDLDQLFDPETARSIARPAFYQSLNVLIATRDLAFLNDPNNVTPAQEARRPLRNRRFIERAFGETQVYPSPMPLICAHDILSSDAFENAFKTGASPEADALRKLFAFSGIPVIEEINNIIARESLKDHPTFAKTNDPAPFRFSDTEPIHVMTDNRLRIEAAFPGIFESLRLSRPLHVIGICLNLTGGEELAWQERKGESLSVTPIASGNYQLGYRDTRKYGDISVGTAVTISGAAASPNQGYHTSAPLAFLMTLFNVRLGWWLGNPGLAGNRTFERANPKVSIQPLVRELTGNANNDYGYVYLSDGGHFDNLGLYEMVLRRVNQIVVSDGGADPQYTYEDLGNAIRKIRIDLGIEIEIEQIGIIPPMEGGPGKYCAFGKIRYSDVDGAGAEEGKLLYIKPVVYKNQGPRDVLNYSTTSPTFPHESTADQFFSESQFESYRRLGLFAVDRICEPRCGPMTVDEFIEAAKKHLKPTPAADFI